jgi:hypothetical protein
MPADHSTRRATLARRPAAGRRWTTRGRTT